MSPHDLDDLLDRGLSSAFLPFPGEGGLPSISPLPEPLPASVGRYDVERQVGEGGMGRILLGQDAVLRRAVAIKILKEAANSEPELVARFAQEARICAHLQHPGIVPVHEFGVGRDGRSYFTMKYVRGQSLDRLLEAPDHSLNVLDVFAKVCQTVAFAHRERVVHRDLKPSNVMVGSFGEVQVMDWGLASAPSLADPKDAPTRFRIVGTPAYMAPELARGEEATDPRVDVFALGAVLCEILTGSPPYRAEDRKKVYLLARDGRLETALAGLNACTADRDLVELSIHCLSLDPEQRPRDAGIVSERLERYRLDLEQRVHRAELAEAETRSRAAAERRAHRLSMLLIVSLLALLIAGMVIWMIISANARSREEAASRGVRLALERAHAEWGAAQQDPIQSVWARAVAAAKEAANLAEGTSVPHHLKAQAWALDREIGEQASRVQADLALAETLLSIRPHLGDERSLQVQEADYATAFGAWGYVDDEGSVKGAVERLKSSQLRSALVAGLDDWAFLRSRRQPASRSATLLAIANQVDDHAWRKALRDAGGEPGHLLRLALSPELSDEPAESVDLLAKHLNAAGRVSEAIEVYRSGFHRFPDDFMIAHNLASLLRQTSPGRSDEVVRLFSVAVARRPESPHVLADLAHVLLTREEYDEALIWLDRIVSLNPNYVYAHYYRGIVALRRHDYEAVARHLGRTVDIDPSNARAHAFMALAFMKSGKTQEGIRSMERLVELEAPADVPIGALPSFALDAGAWDLAERLAHRFVEAAPKDAQSWYELGRIVHQRGFPALTIGHYRKALELDPDFPEACCNLGNLLVESGQFAEGLEFLLRGDANGRLRDRPWRYPSEAWVRRARELVELEPLLPRLREEGHRVPEARRFRALEVLAFRGHYREALGLLDERPPKPAEASYSIQTMSLLCLASLASEAPDDPAAKTWRARVLLGLRAELEHRREDLAAAAERSSEVRNALRSLRNQPYFRALRDTDRLPVDERAAWVALWAEVEGLVSPPDSEERGKK